MPTPSDSPRRWTGAVLLAISAVMLLVGETLLREKLHQWRWLTLIYWSVCLISVLLAVIVALLDMAIMRRRLRAEQRGLVEETVGKILREMPRGTNGAEPEGSDNLKSKD